MSVAAFKPRLTSDRALRPLSAAVEASANRSSATRLRKITIEVITKITGKTTWQSAWFSGQQRGAEKTVGLPSQMNETDIEINHQVQIIPYLYLRPNLQYVIKPNGLNRIANALVLGVEAGITF